MASVVVVPSNGSRSLYVGGTNKISVWVGQSSAAGGGDDSHTKVISQPGHGLTAPLAVYLDIDGKYKASDPSDTNKHGFLLLLSVRGDLLTLATAYAEYDIDFDIGTSDPNSIVYISAGGALSLTIPSAGSYKLVMGAMAGNRRIVYSPVRERTPIF